MMKYNLKCRLGQLKKYFYKSASPRPLAGKKKAAQ
jgi:hypothetical protein